MLSGRSQSSWIQPSALNSQLASSNHFFVEKNPKKPALHSGEFIFLQIHFLQPLFFIKSLISSPVNTAGHILHPPWQKHKYKKAAK